jgi:hypothetical protein
VSGTVLPDTVLVVPFLAIVTEPLEADIAGSLIELAFGEDRTGRSDRLALDPGTLDHARAEAEVLHHPHRAVLQPQAIPVAVMGYVVIAEGDIALACPLPQPGDIVADIFPAVLGIANEAVVARDILVKPDDVLIVAAEVPEGVDRNT